ncbi:hypothetical protein J1605_008318 [Eschrichtius robustus]|uniref:Uncharacterized protein n=1 Tax=Eschrichtius robustus TaxID=9764 RepID=A0AB34GY33_ESCRO|nr:hypothetical protein J1605_008318 [Eschrichtius robustus]
MSPAREKARLIWPQVLPLVPPDWTPSSQCHRVMTVRGCQAWGDESTRSRPTRGRAIHGAGGAVAAPAVVWGQQVVLSYEDEASESRHAELWSGVPYWWGNQVKPQDLVHHLERMKSCSCPTDVMENGFHRTKPAVLTQLPLQTPLPASEACFCPSDPRFR